MKRFILGVLSAVVAVSNASAADLAARPYAKAPVAVAATAYSWTGFYVGANAGYVWSENDFNSTATCGANPPFYFNCGNQAVVQANGTGSQSANGFTGGVQTGYNWQVGSTVIGGEVDVEALRLRATRVSNSAYVALAPGAAITTTVSTGSDWLSTFRGRLGWAVTPGFLLYGTAGLALTNVRVANNYTDAFNAFVLGGVPTSNQIRAGWVAGAGGEWKVAANWSIKAEYLYLDFGSSSVSSTVVEPVGSPGASSLLTTSAKFREQIARVGINYQFGGPVVAKY